MEDATTYNCKYNRDAKRVSCAPNLADLKRAVADAFKLDPASCKLIYAKASATNPMPKVRVALTLYMH